MPNTTKPIADTIDDDEEYEAIPTGIGDEYDFSDGGPLVGSYVGSQERTVPDYNSPDPDATRTTWVHQFAPKNDPETVVFLWGSYTLDQAFVNNEMVRVGDGVRVTYLGKADIKGGKQTMRRYKVELAKRKA